MKTQTTKITTLSEAKTEFRGNGDEIIKTEKTTMLQHDEFFGFSWRERVTLSRHDDGTAADRRLYWVVQDDETLRAVSQSEMESELVAAHEAWKATNEAS